MGECGGRRGGGRGGGGDSSPSWTVPSPSSPGSTRGGGRGGGGGGEDSVVSGSPPSLCVYSVGTDNRMHSFQAGNSPCSVWEWRRNALILA